MLSDLRIVASNPSSDFVLTIRLDGEVVYSGTHARLDHIIQFEADLPGHHRLDIELTGKTPAHTTVDDQGRIVNDQRVTIHEVWIDDVEITRMVWHRARYTHDHNGTTSRVTTGFYQDLGCNGVVTFEFHSPVYEWMLLEC